MTRQNKILLGVFVAAGLGLAAYYFLGRRKAVESRGSFEDFENAAAESKWNWMKGFSHVRREEIIEKWTKNLSQADRNRAIEIAKEWKNAATDQKALLAAEGREIFNKLTSA